MEELRIEIANIKNVHKAQLSLPVEAGLYAIVGENATGKSTKTDLGISALQKLY